jgi:hypothetical protein
MLRLVRVADQFAELETRLPPEWADVRLVLRVEDPSQASRASALLGPLGPGRAGSQLNLTVPRGRVDALRRLLGRLDRDRIRGELELVTYGETVAAARDVPRAAWPPLEEAWMTAVAALPDDWSDAYAEVELGSSDLLDQGALCLAPVNPARPDRGLAFRFRVARTYGYGASADMARRCLARMDERGINGRLVILWAQSDTKSVATQGPVWYVEGRAV